MIEFQSVCKNFGERRVLNDLSFRVDAGEIVCLLAANGGGKTTAMRIAMGLISSVNGRVILGEKTSTLGRVRGIGYMPEERGLFDEEKVRPQLEYLAELHKVPRGDISERVSATLELLGATEYAETKVKNLSLGNKQRVQLAAAIVHDPDILILDEPFSGLDPIGVDGLLKIFAMFAQRKKTVLFSSHQLDVVDRVADKIVLMQLGAITFEGNADELRGLSNSNRIKLIVEFENGRSFSDVDFSRCAGVTDVEIVGNQVEMKTSVASLPLKTILESGLLASEIVDIAREKGSLSSSVAEIFSSSDRRTGD
ncbi:ATP-binding cassette domain-containing protein [Corynebacterium frankenforstense]|uniref:ABC transporter ATP-binding protein n=1 Tax=Corynebacterium TaxID=1716 RepID=UPI00254CD543|nr:MULTISPECIES: ATP-binding cassette domain-containing protein [Corynebacterium]MDK6259796.1 ATP-binding cassette domain-containing protein [Corynebacterium frankenforstense]MDK8894266.1 ATP-binding cassette domain-containing protein [Corynebacterium sp. MSK006]